MKSKAIQKALVSALLVSTAACSQVSSSEVDASAIYGDLVLRRSAGSSNAEVSATFYVGGGTGTVINLDSPAKITFNDKEGIEDHNPIFNVVQYIQNIAVSNENVISRYTDKDGKEYTNSLFMPGSMAFAITSEHVRKSSGFSFNYSSSKAFTSGEKLSISFSGPGNYKTQSYDLVTGAATGAKSIPGSEFSDFPPGSLTVSICRHLNPSAVSPYPKGTSISITSCAAEQTVNLEN